MSEPRDWTVDEDGCSNNSAEFIRLEAEIASLIRSNGGQALDRIWSFRTARLILAQLAHQQNFGPLASRSVAGEDRGHETT